MSDKIPVIAIDALFGPPSPAREIADRAIMDAASSIGFMTISGFAGAELLEPENRARLLTIFRLPDSEKAKLLRWNFDNRSTNLYRGWFPLQPGAVSYKEGIDMGPDIARADAVRDPSDPLCEPTPLPDPALIPGWHEASAAYYTAMEKVGAVLMRSVARSLGLDDHFFDFAFAEGISTLRIIRYPVCEASAAVDRADSGYAVDYAGQRRAIIGKQHVDSGFVTLLAQDGVEGLQARNHGGEWLEVPPKDGTLAVNFGQLLERWTGGKVKATLHRVIAPGRERFSIPFFYEPRADAEIAALPIIGAGRFEPFLYGDYLWDAATKFVEMQGVRHMRKPKRAQGS